MHLHKTQNEQGKGVQDAKVNNNEMDFRTASIHISENQIILS